MSAMTSPVKCRPVAIPGRLYATVTAPIVSGMCSALGYYSSRWRLMVHLSLRSQRSFADS